MSEKITPEKVLAVLSDTPKSQSDIAKGLGCYRGTPRRHLQRLEASGAAKQTDQGWIRTGSEYVAQRIATEGATQASQDMSDEEIIRDAVLRCDWLDPEYVDMDTLACAIESHGSDLCGIIEHLDDCVAHEDTDESTYGDVDYDTLKASLDQADMHIKALRYLRVFQQALVLKKGGECTEK